MRTFRFWLALALGFILVEGGYRTYLYYVYGVGLNFQVVTVTRPDSPNFGTPHNIRGNYFPGDTTWTYFDPQGKHLATLLIKTNNLGWVSHYDYALQKDPDEFRIAMVGDSFTASVTNELPWPDLLHDYLNDDKELLAALGVKKITVLSLAYPGANLSIMANELFDVSKRLDSDMIVASFPINALVRGTRPIVPLDKRDLSLVPGDFKETVPPELNVDGVGVRLMCLPPKAIANTSCRVNPIWFVPQGFNEEDLSRTKRDLAARILWERVVVTPMPLILLEFLNMPIIPRAQAAGYEEPIQYTLELVDFLRSAYPHAMVAVIPTFNTWTARDKAAVERTTSLLLAAEETGREVIDMSRYMPADVSTDVLHSWYTAADGHLSDFGASVFAHAMHEAIREHLLLADASTD